jgi:gliding motility-associated lipoprotein GldH
LIYNQLRASNEIIVKGKTGGSMTEGINKYAFLSFILLSLLFYSCNSNVMFTDSVPMQDEVWTLENAASFKAEITDTISGNNIFFTLRTGASYPYRNIYLFASTTSPAGKTITDTLQYMLADEKGKWYGKGFGDVHELNLPFKANVYFPSKGVYTFRIRHGMRAEALKGVYDIGLKIEKIKL